MASDWLSEVHRLVVERNARECDAQRAVFEAHESLFREFSARDIQRTSLLHKLHLFEHEVSRLATSNDLSQAVKVAKKGFTTIEADLHDEVVHDQIVNLHRTVLEMRKLNKNLAEELSLAKSEYQQALEQNAGLAGELAEARRSLTSPPTPATPTPSPAAITSPSQPQPQTPS